MAKAATPLFRGQGNQVFRTSDPRSAAKRGQTVPYDINGAPTPTVIPPGSLYLSIIDLPAADPAEPLVRMRFTDDYAFAVTGAADSAAAATLLSAFRIRKDGVQVGTVTFAAAGSTGTIAFSDSTFPDGSLFEVYPPATPDATLDQVSITLDLA
jgi:hypothetical protein